MLLSIVIPSYNHERFVLTTIQAALCVQVPEKELIVIDDGSSDASVELILDFIRSRGLEGTVRLVARENRGLVRTLNQGLSMAAGQYIYFTASDDIPIAAGIESLIRGLETNPSQQFALGNALYMRSASQSEFDPTYNDIQNCFFALPPGRRLKKLYLEYPHPLLLQASVFKTETLRQIGGWRENIISDDYALFLRLLSQMQNVGKDFDYRPDVFVCYYRQHDTNVGRNVARQFMTINQGIADLCPKKWQNAAFARNLADLGIMAAKSGDIALTKSLFLETIRLTGGYGLVLSAIPALFHSLSARISRRSAKRGLVSCEPASGVLDQESPSDGAGVTTQ